MPSSEDVQRIKRTLKLDRPLAEQYARFIKKLLFLDLGESIIDRKPVFGTITKYFPNTAVLALSAIMLAGLIALPFGILPAIKKK